MNNPEFGLDLEDYLIGESSNSINIPIRMLTMKYIVTFLLLRYETTLNILGWWGDLCISPVNIFVCFMSFCHFNVLLLLLLVLDFLF